MLNFHPDKEQVQYIRFGKSSVGDQGYLMDNRTEKTNAEKDTGVVTDDWLMVSEHQPEKN